MMLLLCYMYFREIMQNQYNQFLNHHDKLIPVLL